MNKIMKLVLDIMQLGVEISQNTTTDVFVEYCGHVDCLYVRIYESGWEEDKEHYRKDIYLNTKAYQTEEYIIETLEEIYAELENIS